MAKAIGPNFLNEIKAAGVTTDGWTWREDGTLNISGLAPSVQTAIQAVYTAHDPAVIPAATLRDQAIDAAIAADTTIAQLKAMTPAEFDTWWAANVTNATQAITVLKRIARVVIRKLL